MLQFEIWRLNSESKSRSSNQLVVILQHRHLGDLDTCVVAPLSAIDDLPAIGRLRPELTLGRKRFRVIVDRLSVIRRHDLKERVGSAEAEAESIKRGLDQLLYGV